MEINTNFSVLPRTVQERQSPVTEAQALGRSEHKDGSVAQSEQAQETQATKAERSKEEFEQIVEKMQETVKVMQRNLNFSIHDTTGTTIVKVMDAGSGEVIRQMPTEDALVLAERLDEMRSLLFEARA
ncbi:MAG: flagellar protein FlaG [Thiopseudomonas sp.]|nr:flagellar protein FlaG [Thiopseudomonas sp.]